MYFVPLFRVFVPLFRFGELLFRFFHTEQRRNSMFFPLFCVFFYHCSIFCTTVLFVCCCFCFFLKEQLNHVVFHYRSVFSKRNNGTKSEQCVFVPLFLFFSYETTNKNGTVCFCTTVPFLLYCSVFVPLFRFCITVPFYTTLLFFP